MILHCSAASCAVNLCGKVKNILQRSNCSSQRPVSVCVRGSARLLYWIKRQPRNAHKHSNLWLICSFYKHRPMYCWALWLYHQQEQYDVCTDVYRRHTTSSLQAFWIFLVFDRLSVTWMTDFLEVCSSLNSSIRAEKRNREKKSWKQLMSLCVEDEQIFTLLSPLGYLNYKMKSICSYI